LGEEKWTHVHLWSVQSVDQVVISRTRVTTMQRFVFEGLKDVGEIVLDRVDVENVESFAFSGIHFRPAPPGSSRLRAVPSHSFILF